MAQRKDITGMTFDRLTVLRFDKVGRNRETYWICKCICGNEKSICGVFLRRGTIRSCGCLQREWRENYGGQAKPGAAFRSVLMQYKRHAKERGQAWDLTDEQVRQLMTANCFYTGRPPSQIKRALSGELFLYNGIDRLNNDLGYFWDNCVPCCRLVNMMKKTLPYADFISLCREIAAHFEIKEGICVR
jgi:hypothetical protein